MLIGLMMLAGISLAQTSKVQRAYELVQQGKLDSAKMVIDDAMLEPDAAKEYQSWYIMGFIYKEIYKQRETSNVKSSARDIAVQALTKAVELDVQKEQTANMMQNLKYLGSKYNNDAIRTMDTVNYILSGELFEKYIKTYKLCEPGFNEISKRIEYYLAISYKFQGYFEETNSTNILKLTETYLNKALAHDPNSPTANKNFALLYYNMGVTIIKKMDYDVDLEQLYILQDHATKLFKQAEPFMLKAHGISPKDKTILEGLQGIYYQLNDTEKSNLYKKKFEEAGN
jgi:Tfp pilus assembly protein PilF